jgi:hypothetical protein
LATFSLPKVLCFGSKYLQRYDTNAPNQANREPLRCVTYVDLPPFCCHARFRSR